MAELLLSFAANEILQKLQSVVTDTVTGAWGLKGDLLKLSESAGRLQSLLQKLQYAPAVEHDESIKRWLEKLQEVVYAAADVVDEFHYEILRRKVEIKNQLKRKIREFGSSNNPILFRVKMAAKVKEVWASLADMEKGAPLLLLSMTVPAINVVSDGGVVQDSLPERRTDSFLGQRPVGRTKEAERIIQMLQVSSVEALLLSVISIIGFGGLGKTTLAQLVFEEAKKKKLFDEIMWVCVSEPFDVQKILGEMLEKIDKTTGGLRSIDVVVGELRDHLKDKRFLLVLDDVWNKEPGKWDALKMRLENICGKSGNFVIATTRGSDVASIMQSKYVEKLEQLSHTECWNIIKDMVIGISHEMEVIGMNIANKCGGVPLAAKVIGGVLSSRKNKAEWLSILDNDVWNEVDRDKRILGVLKLSFDHLPQPHKLCFAYCSLFPKDVVIEKARLIQLWMAEDFLNTSSTNEGTSAQVMEDVGDEYFHSLHANSFFQDVEVDSCGNVVRCKMHDLLHDLASFISKSQRLQCGSDCIKTSSGRRLRCSCDQVSKVEEIVKVAEDKNRILRCLFCRVNVSLMLSSFRRLQSLDMSDAKLKVLPDTIKKLKHLRYLDISRNETIQELPESITKLYNLQTLRVFECKSLEKFPNKIQNLVSLRHLGIDDKRLVPLGVGCLTNLQTLPIFVVGAKKAQKIDDLAALKELRGEMVICGLENVRDKEEAKKAKMKEKKLSKVVLQWMEIENPEVENFSSSEESKHEEVMRGLEAPTNMQSLTVEWYMGKQFPEWMHELYKLVNLTLKDCRRCQRMPTLGHLPNLRVLTVERMDSMKFIGGEFYGESNNDDTLFPAVEELYIREMKSLVEWVSPKRSEIFPKLHKLDIKDCPNLTSFPLSKSTSTTSRIELQYSSWEIVCCLDFKSLEELCIKDCPKLTFLQIGLTSLSRFSFGHRYGSKELGRSWRMMCLYDSAEIIEEFPKSLEDLRIVHCYSNLSVEAFNGLSFLKHLVFKDYDKPIPNLSSLTSLESFELDHYSTQNSIPTLSSLTSLKKLELHRCSHLESIPPLSSLTSLEHLDVRSCDCIESIPTLSSLTCLKLLRINYCGRLKSIPDLSTLSSLKRLEIGYCDHIESIPNLSSLTSLKVFGVWYCRDLIVLSPNSFCTLTRLEYLTISDCANLSSIPGEIKSCTSLKMLRVTFCGKIVSIDDDILGSLTQLKELSWGSFSQELDHFPGLNSIHLLTSLECLTIFGWYKLTTLPHQLQHLTSITKLELWGFDRVESLPGWLSNLMSLQTLSIQWFQNLKSLPTTNLKHLSKLTRLEIRGCRFLRNRYCKSFGPEWCNISHIPHISID